MTEKVGPSRHAARESAVKYLYQCERERIHYFNSASFEQFIAYFNIDAPSATYMRTIVEGAMADMPAIDETIVGVSENWSIERMSSIDRCVLRLAVFELKENTAPKKVVINEAIELAKKFGTEHSGRFVNGLLDRIAKKKLH